MSNLASPRVLPPVATASAISSSRAPWIVLAIAASKAPRPAKPSSRSAGPPVSRANARAPARSPPPATCATGSSVAGLTSTVGAVEPVTHAPRRWLPRVFMACAPYYTRRGVRRIAAAGHGRVLAQPPPRGVRRDGDRDRRRHARLLPDR